jgi:dihydroflavonol-4-reductase
VEGQSYAQTVAPRGPEPGTTAVVTGASGFVGRALVARLLEDGWSVRTVGRRSLDGTAAAEHHHAVDIRERSKLLPAFDGADVVYHLAAKITLASRDEEAWDINVRGSKAAAGAALEVGVGRFVHCSSVHAFDPILSRPVLSELSPRSVGDGRPIYDRSKAAAEVEIRAAIESGLDATIVNPTAIIGPGDRGPSRINAVIDQAARGRLPVVVEGGFDWVDVRDVVDGIMSATVRGRTGENYLLGGHQASALSLLRLAASCGHRRGPLLAIPGGLAVRLAPVVERVSALWHSDAFTPASIAALASNPVVDWTKAATELGYRSRPLEESVRDTVRWFEAQRQTPPPKR